MSDVWRRSTNALCLPTFVAQNPRSNPATKVRRHEEKLCAFESLWLGGEVGSRKTGETLRVIKVNFTISKYVIFLIHACRQTDLHGSIFLPTKRENIGSLLRN